MCFRKQQSTVLKVFREYEDVAHELSSSVFVYWMTQNRKFMLGQSKENINEIEKELSNLSITVLQLCENFLNQIQQFEYCIKTEKINRKDLETINEKHWSILFDWQSVLINFDILKESYKDCTNKNFSAINYSNFDKINQQYKKLNKVIEEYNIKMDQSKKFLKTLEECWEEAWQVRKEKN